VDDDTSASADMVDDGTGVGSYPAEFTGPLDESSWVESSMAGCGCPSDSDRKRFGEFAVGDDADGASGTFVDMPGLSNSLVSFLSMSVEDIQWLSLDIDSWSFAELPVEVVTGRSGLFSS